ncbi:MAG: formylmethanofuran dehydrogenase subunit C [Thermoprotei archaeon]|nr:MAG: formylmethanofuran dehydrogenase subunit C [Thermoprotei archaeon]RLF25380.1 MAG: formylmethanofuran dehydrogenase subunit C [Thermoprotei archaeon]
MRIIIVRPRKTFRVPIEAECLSPKVLSELDLEETKKLRVYEGNKIRRLEDLFIIKEEREGSEESLRIVLEGDFSKVWRIGEDMESGEVVVKGNCGPFLGLRMRGGRIVVHGNAGSWLGAEMSGGSIEVHGDAGDYVGAIFRGERPGRGMKGGEIRIHGNAGVELGGGMNKGLIVVDGSCGVMPGRGMRGGSILIRGDCEGRAGARASGGKVVICGKAGGVLPTFYISGIVPTVKVRGERLKGPFYLFVGDVLSNISCGCRLYISVNKNPELESYKELLEVKDVGPY